MTEPNAQESARRGWRDDPISTVDEDRLRRAPVA